MQRNFVVTAVMEKAMVERALGKTTLLNIIFFFQQINFSLERDQRVVHLEVFLTVQGNLWEETNKKSYNEKRGSRLRISEYIRPKKLTSVHDSEVLYASAFFTGEKLNEKGLYPGFSIISITFSKPCIQFIVCRESGTSMSVKELKKEPHTSPHLACYI